MAKKKQKIIRQNYKTKKKILITSITLFLVLIISVIGYKILENNRDFYSLGSKEQLQQELEVALDARKLPGELVYTKVSDQGCEENGVGLAGYYDCTYLAQKFYKNNIKTTPIGALSNPNVPEISSFISNGRNLKARYIQSDYTVYPPNTLKEILANNTKPDIKLVQLNRDEYLAGWLYKVTYWHCSDKTVFQLPCPVPPSPIKS